MNNDYWKNRIDTAQAVVKAHLSPTPLVPIRVDGFNAPVWAKLETFQPVGAFKVRGALAAVAVANNAGTEVVTASAGNHGLGVAYSASALGAHVSIFVPENGSPAKIAALRTYPVDLHLVGHSYDEAEAAALAYANSNKAVFLSAYNHPDVIAGQATIMAELASQLPRPFQVVAPVGGGGLISGLSLAAPEDVRVIGVESERSTAVSAAMHAGRIIRVEVGDTIADGLAGNIAPNTIAPEILSSCRTRVVQVSEQALRRAVKQLATGHGLVVEGAGAAGMAAICSDLIDTDLPTVIVLSGRNIAVDTLRELLA